MTRPDDGIFQEQPLTLKQEASRLFQAANERKLRKASCS